MARLDLVVGTWIDQKESQYIVEKDVGAETCSVSTYRKSGETQHTQRLIRLQGGKVWWGSSFCLDCQQATSQEIVWVPVRQGVSSKFHWTRYPKARSQEEIGRAQAAARAEGTRGRARRGNAWAPRASQEEAQVAVEEDAQVNDNDQGGDNSYLDPKSDVPDDWDQDTDDEEDEKVAEPKGAKHVDLPVNGINWAQDTIGIRFRNGYYLVDTLKDMLEGKLKLEKLPRIHVVLHEDNLYAITGNRRLWVAKKYGEIINSRGGTIQEVKIRALHIPPADMHKKWVKSRFTTASIGEIGYLNKHTTFESMEEALISAEGPQSWRASWLSEAAGSKLKRMTWREVEPANGIPKEEEQATERVEEDEASQKESSKLSDVAQRSLLKLLSEDPTESTSCDKAPEQLTNELTSMAGTQLLYVAALLFSQARSSDKAKVKDDLMELGRCMEQFDRVGRSAENGFTEVSVQDAAREIFRVADELKWIDCSHNLALQVLQAAQLLEMVAGEAGDGTMCENDFQGYDAYYDPGMSSEQSWPPSTVFPAEEDCPEPAWLWQWQYAGQMHALKSLAEFRQKDESRIFSQV